MYASCLKWVRQRWSDKANEYQTRQMVLFTCMNAGSKWISFITEGLPWKITVNNWSIQKKTTGTTFPLYKKEWERRSPCIPVRLEPRLLQRSKCKQWTVNISEARRRIVRTIRLSLVTRSMNKSYRNCDACRMTAVLCTYDLLSWIATLVSKATQHCL